MTKYKGTKPPSETKRTVHQVLLNTKELDDLYELSDLPKSENKSVALRQVLRGYRDQINENNNLKQYLKQLSK